MSKNQHRASEALRELTAFREARKAPARKLVTVRWPDRAVEASVSARIRRCWWAVVSGLLESGTVSW